MISARGSKLNASLAVWRNEYKLGNLDLLAVGLRFINGRLISITVHVLEMDQ